MTTQNAPVASPTAATSNLTYEPPAQPPVEEHQIFSDNLQDVISQIDEEYTPDPLEGEPLSETPPVEPEPAAEPTPDKEDPTVARGVERLVQREIALQQREQVFQQALTQYDAMKAELAQYKAKPAFTTALEQLPHSPSEAIKAMGHDPAHVVRLMIAEQLRAEGKEVPVALREALQEADGRRRDSLTNNKIKELEEKLAQREAAQTSTMHFNGITAGAHEYIKGFSKPDVAQKAGKEMPEVARLAAASPDVLHNEIMEEIVKDARARSAADPNGAPLTYEQAAKLVEAKLGRYKSLFGPTQNAQPTKPAQGRNAPPQTRPPVAPLKPWQTAGNELEAALKDAEREFHRSEAQLRARR